MASLGSSSASGSSSSLLSSFAVAGASLIRYGVTAMSSAGSETASSTPLRSMIAPRRAGTVIVSTCWVCAACLSDEALTVPIHVALSPAKASRARKPAKSRPMRRWIRDKTPRTGPLLWESSRTRRTHPSRLLGRDGRARRGAAGGGAARRRCRGCRLGGSRRRLLRLGLGLGLRRDRRGGLLDLGRQRRGRRRGGGRRARAGAGGLVGRRGV